MSYRSKRDANESLLVSELEVRGWYVKRMCRLEGFDLLLAKAGRLVVAECKNPAMPLSKQRLTPAEATFQAAMRAHGIPVELLRTAADLHVLERDRGDFYAAERNR